MVDEKVKAFGEAAANVVTGGTTRSVVKVPKEGSRQSPPFDKVINASQSSVRQDRKVPAACGTRRTFGTSARQRQLVGPEADSVVPAPKPMHFYSGVDTWVSLIASSTDCGSAG